VTGKPERAHASPITPVMAGSRCIGFTMRRGPAGHHEAFDECRSLGLYPDQEAAIAAIAAAASTPGSANEG
jgi:hypothetical protein